MHDRYSRNTGVALVALLLAGCGGGGGSDDTAVSAAPEASAPVAATSATAGPVPAEPAAPGPVAAVPAAPGSVAATPAAPGSQGSPLAAPVGVKPDPAIPEDPAPLPSVPGELVWSALQTGVSDDPNPPFFNTNSRQVFLVTDKMVTDKDTFIFLGGASGNVGSMDNLTSDFGLRQRFAEVRIIGSEGVIDAVTANGLDLTGPQLDLRNIDPALDATVGTWTNGAWSANLIVQSTDEQDQIRVCWNVHLPPLPEGFGSGALVDPVPIKRLMCGVYSATEPGPDIGGYVEDDFNGTVRRFRHSWPENAG